MRKISVAFEPGGGPTLRWAAQVARAMSAPLELVNVFEPTSAEVPPSRYHELVEARTEELARLTAEVGDDLDVDIVVLEGHEPLEEFAHHLDSSPGGLGVIGAHGTHRIGGLGFGFPGYSLLHHTAEPIAMIHPAYEPLMGGAVVVGVDGSAANAVAVEWAEAFAAAIGGTLHAVFAFDPLAASFDAPDGSPGPTDDVRAIVDRVAAIPAELHVTAGHPSKEILYHARRKRAAAVVVGTRGHGGFEGLVLGRVPGQLVAHCTAPLIVVPH